MNHFYIDKIGSGEFEIELHAYVGEKMVDTATEKINLVSTSQRLEELIASINTLQNSINDICAVVNSINAFNCDIKYSVGSISSDVGIINMNVDSIEDSLNNQ